MASIGGTLGLSGLPLADLMENLRKVEEAPLTVLTNRKTVLQTKISAYGVISNALSTLQTAVQGVGKADTFGTLKATSSKTDALTATAPANGGAVAGTYTIAIENLASNQSLATAGQASRTDAIGSGGTVTLTLGDGSTRTLTLEAGQTSLEGLRAAINGYKDEDGKTLGVSATLLNSGDADAPHRLTLSTSETGLDARVTKIEVSGNAELAAILDYEEGVDGGPAAMAQHAEARNAQVTINGIGVTSGSNTLEGAIEGVTLNLLAATEDAPLTLTIAADNAVATAAIENFVSSYNALQSIIRQLTAYDSEENAGSALTGDRVARSVQSQLRNVLGEAVDNGGFATLAQIGITTNINTGALDLDQEKLAQAMKEDPDKVAALFTGEKGLATKLESSIKSMLDKDGLITNATEGLKTSVKDIDGQYERIESRVENTMSRYQAQFVALERFMAQMNSTSGYLAQQLDMLAAMAKNSNN